MPPIKQPTNLVVLQPSTVASCNIFLIFHRFSLKQTYLLPFSSCSPLPNSTASPFPPSSPDHLLTTRPTHTSNSTLDVPVVEANLSKSFFPSILAKVAALTILPKKIMNVLSRKGRSRSKREVDKPRPPMQPDTQPREPFVNVGLQRWEIQREEWTTKDPDYVPKRTPRPPPSQRDADAEELYAALLTPNYQPLPRHVPLGELIDILQEVRELVG